MGRHTNMERKRLERDTTLLWMLPLRTNNDIFECVFKKEVTGGQNGALFFLVEILSTVFSAISSHQAQFSEVVEYFSDRICKCYVVSWDG